MRCAPDENCAARRMLKNCQLKKMPALSGWHSDGFIPYYCCAGAGVFAGAVSAAGAGVAVAGAGVVAVGAGVAGAASISCITLFWSDNEPVKLRLDNMINAIRMVAKVQVLLSRKSVVFCTPPIICVPPRLDDKPPPFGFCTMITTINKKHTMVIKTRKTENVFITIYYFVVKALSPKFGLQRNYFFPDISKLKFHTPEWLSDTCVAPSKHGPKSRS